MSDNVQAPRDCSTIWYCVSGKKCQRPKDANGYHLRVKSAEKVAEARVRYRKVLQGRYSNAGE